MFARTYAEARNIFDDIARKQGYESYSYVMPNASGPNGEVLSTNVAYHINEKTRRLLIVVSGTHGVEGYYGSAMQSAWLDQHAVNQLPNDVGILMIHAINPHGFSYDNRVDMSECINGVSHRVDPNRNFVDFSKPLPENPGYVQMENDLVPRNWYSFSRHTSTLKLAWAAITNKARFVNSAMSGQFSSPDGFSFAGNHPCWSNNTLHKILADIVDSHSTHIDEISFIDLHTGIGKKGEMALYPMVEPEDASFKQLRQWLNDLIVPSSTPYNCIGAMAVAIRDKYQDKGVVSFAIECGTQSSFASMMALRAQNWLDKYAKADDQHHFDIQNQMRKAFYPEQDKQWQHDITAKTLSIFDAVLKGMRNKLDANCRPGFFKQDKRNSQSHEVSASQPEQYSRMGINPLTQESVAVQAHVKSGPR